MKTRYSNSRSKQKMKQSRQDFTTNQKGINIQIFNITSRNRNKKASTSRRDNSVNFQDFLQIPSEQKMKRGSSVFQRKSQKDKQIHLTSYGPIIPNYNLVDRKINTSSKKLKNQNKSLALNSQTNTHSIKKDYEFHDIGVEQLHYEMVKFQQKCKQVIKK